MLRTFLFYLDILPMNLYGIFPTILINFFVSSFWFPQNFNTLNVCKKTSNS